MAPRSDFVAIGVVYRMKRRGFIILMIPLIAASLMTIAFGIFNFVITEIRISGDLNDSFEALYAADEAMESVLYADRISGVCPGPLCTFTLLASSPSTACMNSIYTAGTPTDIKTLGYTLQSGSDCLSSPRAIQRSLEVKY